MNQLQFLATLPDRVLETEGNWGKLQKLMKSFFPKTQKAWFFTNVRKQDWTVVQSEKLNGVMADEKMAVPKFRLLPDNYR